MGIISLRWSKCFCFERIFDVDLVINLSLCKIFCLLMESKMGINIQLPSLYFCFKNSWNLQKTTFNIIYFSYPYHFHLASTIFNKSPPMISLKTFGARKSNGENWFGVSERKYREIVLFKMPTFLFLLFNILFLFNNRKSLTMKNSWWIRSLQSCINFILMILQYIKSSSQ